MPFISSTPAMYQDPQRSVHTFLDTCLIDLCTHLSHTSIAHIDLRGCITWYLRGYIVCRSKTHHMCRSKTHHTISSQTTRHLYRCVSWLIMVSPISRHLYCVVCVCVGVTYIKTPISRQIYRVVCVCVCVTYIKRGISREVYGVHLRHSAWHLNASIRHLNASINHLYI